MLNLKEMLLKQYLINLLPINNINVKSLNIYDKHQQSFWKWKINEVLDRHARKGIQAIERRIQHRIGKT